MRIARLPTFFLFLPLILSACGEQNEPLIEYPLSQIYGEASDQLLRGRGEKASALFEQVEQQYPGSPWATRAQIMSAFSLYQDNLYPEAIATLDRFVSLNPSHRDIAYAHYLRALCFYEQIDNVIYDKSHSASALQALDLIIQRFPQSAYARDAALKRDLVRDHLAGGHMSIGRYYLRRKKYLAAINRFHTVVAQYETTSHTPEALHRLVESYLALGVLTEAQASASVLGYNFPESKWYARSYALLEGRVPPLNNPGSES